MQNFVRQKNIDNYRRLLAQTQDAGERRTLEKLLADELARQEEPPPPQPKQRDI